MSTLDRSHRVAGRGPLDAARRPVARTAAVLTDRAERAVGGRARLRVVLLLSFVIALDGADKATVAVNADSLEHAFSIGPTQIGLLISATALASAVATLPTGVLTDRVTRTRLLSISVILWGVAMVAAATATTYGFMLAARVVLGIVTATAGPTVASLVGDFFPGPERAHLYGYILAGELFGTGLGYVVSANLSQFLSWRASFAWLVLPGMLLAWLLNRLPEPARGGSDQLPSVRRETSVSRVETREKEDSEDPSPEAEHPMARQVVDIAESDPLPDRVLREDPRHMPAWRAYRYVLGTRTVVLMITASALGYFFFTGVRSFGLLYATHRYGMSKSTASALVLVVGVGILAGLMAGARLPDIALRHGHAHGRVLVPAVALLVVGPVIAPGFLASSPLIALPFLTVGSGLLAAPNPPLDAARLDVVPPGLWGRSEAARTLVRVGAEASAPLLFGFFASQVFSGHGPNGGLEATFLVCLAPLTVAGLLLLVALRTYPRDVATALASMHESGSAHD
ncbi:MFS transporter [Streptomyces antnestii]|uniref:MFS transporter n=1 Tax=Streptomyces antnestii TaxID=2494256 RepID=A0A3S2VU69_9ACTN|nr:MFS transporter [Streptomyces sp. San01]RVU17589.1 MFS transporter [Streptomyces sp. San01]